MEAKTDFGFVSH